MVVLILNLKSSRLASNPLLINKFMASRIQIGIDPKSKVALKDKKSVELIAFQNNLFKKLIQLP
jgi:hypothetical protein